MKVLIWIIIVILLFAIVYFAGPKPAKPSLVPFISEPLASNLQQLEQEIIQHESSLSSLKPDNQARIVWADESKKEKTEFAVVYLHGFSASCGEGYPVNLNFAKRYGCNMYMARMQSHGVDVEEALVDLTPENYLESAKYAVSVGRQLGEKVILISTSTGGTLSLAIASENPWVHSLILYSPNIDVVDQSANILLKPWGIQLARLIKGKYNDYDDPPEVQKYWQSKYRLEAVQAMKGLVDATMNKETFGKINQPLFLGYYYKNEEQQDPTVSVERMLEMYDQVSTPVKMKRKIAFPDAGCHPIPSEIYNKNYQTVQSATYQYAEEVLGMKPVVED